MERNYMKEYGISSRSLNYNSNLQISGNGKLKEYSWNHISQIHVGYREGDSQESSGGSGLFSWPPRSYTCSFCKREFRSAQALGGHMNVHRRDRARMRQSSPLMENVGQLIAAPTLNLNVCPNYSSPNPSSNVPPPINSPKLTSVVTTSSISALSSSSPSLASLCESKNLIGTVDGSFLFDSLHPKAPTHRKPGARNCFSCAESLDGFKLQDGCKFLNKGEIVRLDLEIGVLSDHTKEDLDLELRLGYCS